MAVTYGYFNSVNGDRKYNADDISNYFLKLISNGVFATPSNAMQVQAIAGMSVSVSAGWGFINCKWINNDAPYVLTLNASDVVLNRIDRVVLRLNSANSMRSMGIYIKTGSAANSPQPPTLTRDGNVYELSLAQIYIGADVTEITQANITDERANTSVCGWVTGLIDQIDTTNLFAQYDAAFNEWFTNVKETLATTTLVRQYTSTYTTTTTAETTIPVNISVYNDALDVLNVYVNGMKLTPNVDFTETNGVVTLAQTLDVIGTVVGFEVLKSIDGSEAESVIDMVYTLQTEVGKITANDYICNGVDDNVKLIEFISNWLLGQNNKCEINIIGTFGVDDTTTTAYDGNDYSFVYANARAYSVTLNFENCNVIKPRFGNSFGYFKNCNVENLAILYNDKTNDSAVNVITAVNATVKNCDVYGVLNGENAVTVYNTNNARLIECDCNITGYNVIYGIVGNTSIIDTCNINVTSKGAGTSAYGVSIIDASRADNSTFTATTAATATTASASGGIGGGYYSNCLFVGKGGLKGQGFYVQTGNLLSCNNCIFRGYTEDNVNGWGVGLTGASSDTNTVFLTGINCNQIPIAGYSQTASMTFTAGAGSYMGTFYTAVTTPSSIVSYGRVIRNRV